MSLFFGSRYPWTNLHELNLDWIMGRVKEVSDQGEAMQQATAESLEATAAANTAATRVNEALADIDSTIDAGFDRILSGVGDYIVDKTGGVQIKGGRTVIESDTGITMSANNGDIDIKAERPGAAPSRINVTADATTVKGEFNVQNTNGGFDLVNTAVRRALEVVYNGILQLFSIDNGEIKPVIISGIETVTDDIAATAETRANLAASCGYVDANVDTLNYTLGLLSDAIADAMPYIVTGTYNGSAVSISKTYNDIKTAINAGRNVILRITRTNIADERSDSYVLDLAFTGAHSTPGFVWYSFGAIEYVATYIKAIGINIYNTGTTEFGIATIGED